MTAIDVKQDGVVSYYHDSLHGNLTANGEIYNKNVLSCAHKEYPFGTVLLVMNPKNNKYVIVRVNDRGPFIEGRDIDLSRKAAETLGIITDGVVEVEYVIIKYYEKRKRESRSYYTMDRR